MKCKHITNEDRIIIQTGIENGDTCTLISTYINKHKSTVSKEIKLHREKVYSTNLKRECATYKVCKHSRQCFDTCFDFIQFKCNRRDRSPGACNGCINIHTCRFDKFKYFHDKAQRCYESTLVDSRTGVNLTTTEAYTLGTIIKKGLDKGHSLYHIKENNPLVSQSLKTLYTYIDNSVFEIVKIHNVDLRRKVAMKVKNKAKSKSKLKKRKDRSFLINRTYQDFKEFTLSGDKKVVEMDTVENSLSGPYIQTFLFRDIELLICIYHERKTAANMATGLQLLIEYVGGIKAFKSMCDCIITDRGGEFQVPELFENLFDGHIFYCDPMNSNQKSKIERSHVYLRYIVPKGHDLKVLGLRDQTSMNLINSHVNSFSRKKLNNKCSMELLGYIYPDTAMHLQNNGIHQIPALDVILKPSLLK